VADARRHADGVARRVRRKVFRAFMTPADRYSWFDRLLYRIAFTNLDLQQDLARLEDRIFADRLAGVTAGPPVFITALPRAGTTILLEIFAATEGFASHTYRDLPFVLCPLIWNALSRPLRTRGGDHERAHRDGIRIGYDSPEAFEEVVWRRFFPDHFREGHVRLWDAGENAETFRTFFVSHMRKIVALRSATASGRYVSKNNANIARFTLLKRLFPDCHIVVPFRQPADQAHSLWRQHLLFSSLHERSRFSRQYMAWLGHLEFGANLAPIAFEGFDAGERHDVQFWLRYWIAAYEHVLRNSAELVLVNFEELCTRPDEVLRALGRALGAPDDSLRQAAARLIRPSSAGTESVAGDPALLDRAAAIYAELSRRAISLSTVKRPMLSAP
jgi:hypothetical protein